MKSIDILSVEPLNMDTAQITENLQGYSGIIDKHKLKISDAYDLRFYPHVNLTDTRVETRKLTENFKEFIDSLKEMFDNLEKTVSSYYIDEIELKVAVSAEGGFKLIGQATAGVETGITIKLKRKE